MKCIIIEDQPPAQRILKKYIADMGTLQLLATFPDAIQAMEFLRRERVDLLFLDLHLPRISGIDFLKALAHPPHVILTTAFSEYALEGYELNVVDYLLKPFSFQRFVKAVTRVPQPPPVTRSPETETAETAPPREMFIKSGHELVKVLLPDIVCIKSDLDYTELFQAGKRLLSAESLRYWEETLPEDQFIRIHKSYIINLDRIEKISGNQVFLSGDMVIPVGRAYKVRLLERINWKG